MAETDKTALDLHAQIMNLPCIVPGGEKHENRTDGAWVAGFKQGHKAARHDACDLLAASPQSPAAQAQGAMTQELAARVVKALEDLSFECFALFGTCAPSRDTYNRTFGVLEEARAALRAASAPTAATGKTAEEGAGGVDLPRAPVDRSAEMQGQAVDKPADLQGAASAQNQRKNIPEIIPTAPCPTCSANHYCPTHNPAPGGVVLDRGGEQ